MLPYETERHARGIFAKLIVGLSGNGALPNEAEVRVLATASLHIARDFAQVANRRSLPHTGTGLPQLSKVLTFEQLAHEWLCHTPKAWERQLRSRTLNRFGRYLFPRLGGRSASEVTTAEIVAALRAIEDAGYLPLAHIMLADIKRMYQFATKYGC